MPSYPIESISRLAAVTETLRRMARELGGAPLPAAPHERAVLDEVAADLARAALRLEAVFGLVIVLAVFGLGCGGEPFLEGIGGGDGALALDAGGPDVARGDVGNDARVEVEPDAVAAAIDALEDSRDARSSDGVGPALDAEARDARESEPSPSADAGALDAPAAPDVVDEPTPPPEASAGDGCADAVHTNGLGASWTDCNPLGTFTGSEAWSACNATYGPVLCMLRTSNCGSASPDTVCASNGAACWTFGGADAGHVRKGGACPTASDPGWQ